MLIRDGFGEHETENSSSYANLSRGWLSDRPSDVSGCVDKVGSPGRSQGRKAASFAKEFAEMQETTKVALHLSKRSLKVLKRKALKCRAPYQTLIRNVVYKYAEGMEKTV